MEHSNAARVFDGMPKDIDVLKYQTSLSSLQAMSRDSGGKMLEKDAFLFSVVVFKILNFKNLIILNLFFDKFFHVLLIHIYYGENQFLELNMMCF